MAADTQQQQHKEAIVQGEDPAATSVEYTEAVVAHGEDHGGSSPIQLDLGMFLLFLTVFLLASFVLKRFAWKPILAALDEREKTIQDSIDNAAKIEADLSELEGTVSSRIAEADGEAKEILDRARNGAKEAASTIEEKAKEEAAITRENANREISAAEESVKASLRKDSADLAIELAGKILKGDLDDAKARSLTDTLIKEL